MFFYASFYCMFNFYRLAINLLRSLCADINVREQVKVFDGVPALLRYCLNLCRLLGFI